MRGIGSPASLSAWMRFCTAASASSFVMLCASGCSSTDRRTSIVPDATRRSKYRGWRANHARALAVRTWRFLISLGMFMSPKFIQWIGTNLRISNTSADVGTLAAAPQPPQLFRAVGASCSVAPAAGLSLGPVDTFGPLAGTADSKAAFFGAGCPASTTTTFAFGFGRPSPNTVPFLMFSTLTTRWGIFGGAAVWRLSRRVTVPRWNQ
mmetsp:Transcript_29701/g.91701  ORF Transcript_29701/g.91701 Transcript_29701/m.91701 type:complete len:208 (-) Transcript_29701:1156-1779(-)